MDFCLSDPWVIIAGESYILFLHNYNSMQLFRHIDKVQPTKVELLSDRSVVVLLNRDGSIMCFKLKQKKVDLIKTLQIPFVIPFCLVEK